jgi:hypothetical protein
MTGSKQASDDEPELGSISGYVTSVAISGAGPHSYELVFTVRNERQNRQEALQVTSSPDYEPPCFTAYANAVFTAYANHTALYVGYFTEDQALRPYKIVVPPPEFASAG